MNQVMGVVKMYFRDRWQLLMGWVILLSGFLINLAIAIAVRGSHEEAFQNGGVIGIYIVSFVVGIVSVAQMFPFAIGFSVSRKNYILGTAVTYTLVSASTAVILTLLSLAEKTTKGWGDLFYFFNLPWLNDGTVFQQLVVVFVLLMFLYFAGFTIGSVYRRYGQRGMIVCGGAALLLVSSFTLLATYYQWWVEIGHWIIQQSALQFVGWLAIVVFALIVVSRGMLLRSEA